MTAPPNQTLTITALGHRGEGIAEHEGKRLFVPLALPGETITAEIAGDRARLLSVEHASPDRGEPFCPHFGVCGGCQLQHLARTAYEAFKIGLVETPLLRAGIATRVTRLIDAHGRGRRRATLHARKEGAGFMRLRSHQVADIDRCPILVPELDAATDIARAVQLAVGESDVAFTATLDGLDVAVRTERRQAKADRLIPLFERFRLARLALNGETVFQTSTPRIAMGRATLDLPVGSFLQATAEAERHLVDYVTARLGKAKSVADLFCGLGPFALAIAETVRVHALDSDKAGIASLEKAVRHTRGLKALTAKARDLFRDPLTRFELEAYDCVVLDPPRAGAEAQIAELAKSPVPSVLMIACDAQSFARDAAVLIGGGYAMSDLVAVDQFTQSTHIEICATFRR